MRILINALGATMGGGLRHLTNFLPALADSQGAHRYDVLMRSSIPPPCQSDCIRFIRWDDGRAASLIRRSLADLMLTSIEARNYDVLVSLMNFGPVFCPIPHVIFQRNALYYSSDYRASLGSLGHLEVALRRRWTIESMRFAQTIVTPSNAMAALIRQDCPGLDNLPFQTLYHGFDVSTLGPSAAHDAKFEVDGSPVLLYSAHLGRYKNFEVLLKALQHLRGRYPKIKLVLTFGPADHPKDFEHYETMAHSLGVHENVLFAGRVGQRQMAGLYRACDAFLFPSFCESFGFPLLEAMGSGVPILASDIPTNRELCGEAAVYFAPDDAAACAEQIEWVISDNNNSESLIQKGYQVLRSFDWSWQRYAREFNIILERVAKSHSN